MSTIKAIIGLGNPGTRYARTRHNIGFMAVDAIAETYEAPTEKSKFDGLLREVSIKRQAVTLFKPQTFMNLSGQPTQKLMQWYKLKPEQLLVVYDDVDLAPGKLKTKIGGGHGGHNGLRSLDECIGANYHRLRLGVGRPPMGEVSDYVLGQFTTEEIAQWQKISPLLCEHLPLMLKGESALFLTRIAAALQPPKPPKPPRPTLTPLPVS